VRCHKNSWIYLKSTYDWWLLRPTITIRFDSKFQIIAQLDSIQIRFEMKKHYSHSSTPKCLDWGSYDITSPHLTSHTLCIDCWQVIRWYQYCTGIDEWCRWGCRVSCSQAVGSCVDSVSRSCRPGNGTTLVWYTYLYNMYDSVFYIIVSDVWILFTGLSKAQANAETFLEVKAIRNYSSCANYHTRKFAIADELVVFRTYSTVLCLSHYSAVSLTVCLPTGFVRKSWINFVRDVWKWLALNIGLDIEVPRNTLSGGKKSPQLNRNLN